MFYVNKKYGTFQIFKLIYDFVINKYNKENMKYNNNNNNTKFIQRSNEVIAHKTNESGDVE